MASFSAIMTDKQTLPVGVTVLDQDNQPFTELPEGASVTFSSSNEQVCGVTMHEDGMNADITSGKVGTATITVHAEGFDTTLPDDVISITVKNSAANALNTTVGAPVDET